MAAKIWKYFTTELTLKNIKQFLLKIEIYQPLSICSFIHLVIHLSIYPSYCWSAHSFIHPFSYFNYSSIHPSYGWSVHSFIHPFILVFLSLFSSVCYLEWFFPSMCTGVSLQVTKVSKAMTTNFTLIWSFSCMYSNVGL